MKRNEIKAREVIAYQHGSYGYLTPAAVVDMKSLWTQRNNRDSTTYRRAAGWKCGSDRLYHERTGYLVVKVAYFGGVDLEAGLKLLREWLSALPDQIDEPFVKQAAASMPKGLTMCVEANRDLHGEWETAKSAEAAAEEQRQERLRRDLAEDHRRARNINRVNRALDEARIPGMARRSSGGLVEIELSALAALLGVELEGEES